MPRPERSLSPIRRADKGWAYPELVHEAGRSRRFGGIQLGHGQGGQPQTFRAASATSRSFVRSSSIVSALPSTDVANPHCGETANRSRGT